MQTWKERAWLAYSMLSLLSGWLSPGYAAKTLGPQLQVFLNSSPVIAAVFAQSTFAFLLLLPSSTSANSGQATRNWRICCSVRAFKFGCPFGLLLLAVHSAWYASITRTNVATNTVLWNTDTVTTPLIVALFSLQLPSLGALIAGGLATAGVFFSVDGDPTGNTPLGCALVLGASLGYATSSVLVEKLRGKADEELTVVHMLAWAGIDALLVALIANIGGAIFVPEDLTTWYGALPSPQWLLFLGSTAILLNIGWLWCSELAGATWTAMVACLSIPIAMNLDYLLFGIVPELIGFAGGALVLFGFAVASFTEGGGPDEPCCRRWKGCVGGGTAPLLLPVHSMSQMPESTLAEAHRACEALPVHSTPVDASVISNTA